MAFREEPSLALLGSFIAAAAVLGERRALACGCVRVERPVRSGTDDGRNTAFLCSILATVEREGKCERPTLHFFSPSRSRFRERGKERKGERPLFSLFVLSRKRSRSCPRGKRSDLRVPPLTRHRRGGRRRRRGEGGESHLPSDDDVAHRVGKKNRGGDSVVSIVLPASRLARPPL